MKPVETQHTNSVLKAPEGQEDRVMDLPIAGFVFPDGTHIVESCWEMTPEELEIVKSTRKIYVVCEGTTHPPIILLAEDIAGVK